MHKDKVIRKITDRLKEHVGPRWLRDLPDHNIVLFVEWAAGTQVFNMRGNIDELATAFRAYIVGLRVGGNKNIPGEEKRNEQE
jgi:hypothetical protein